MKKVTENEMRDLIQDAFVDIWIIVADAIDADRSLNEYPNDSWMADDVEVMATNRILRFLEANDLLETN